DRAGEGPLGAARLPQPAARRRRRAGTSGFGAFAAMLRGSDPGGGDQSADRRRRRRHRGRRAGRNQGVAMDFRHTTEQQQFRDSVLRFAQKELAAGALARAHDAKYPWDVAKKMAQQGLLGITIAKADGGQGGTLIDAVLAIEAVASACPRSANVIQAGNFGPIRVLAEYGSPHHKQYLKKLLSGEAVISVGMTEPEAGSAVTDLATKATRDGKGWRVSGSK